MLDSLSINMASVYVDVRHACMLFTRETLIC